MGKWWQNGFLAIVLLGVSFATHAKAEGTLVAATAADPQHFNPGITTASHTHAVADSLFNGLVALGRSAQAIPDLAKSWTIEDGGRVYRFKLAPAIHWHDGKPLTADDVMFTFKE